MSKIIGVLILADIVNFTDQAGTYNSGSAVQALEYFENKIRPIIKKYNAVFIKRVHDAALIFIAIDNVKNVLGLILELRGKSLAREFDHAGINAKLRIVAHFSKFTFRMEGDSLTDVSDNEATKLFRFEKFAGAYEVVITSNLFELLRDELEENNIGNKNLGGQELKGFNLYPIVLFRLIFPRDNGSDNIDLLKEALGKLEAKTREIPIFGGLYPPVGMAKNFLNLSVDMGYQTTDSDEDGENEAADKPDYFEVRNTGGTKHHMSVRRLYENHSKGIILGLPGSGKTTILSYFAYREFQRKHENRVVLFVECRNIISYEECQKMNPYINSDESGLLVESYLKYFTFNFIYGGQGDREFVPSEIKSIKTAWNTVIEAYTKGRLTLLIDALDEVESTSIKETIVNFFKGLLEDSYQYSDKNPEDTSKAGNNIYLSSRYSEKPIYFQRAKSEVFNPFIEVLPLDLEQLREMAAHFYGKNSDNYKEFDQVVWKEEIAAKVGGTPLTALLVLAYFKNFKQFGSRYAMYDLIFTFMLIRAWENIKKGNFVKDMDSFFKAAKNNAIFNESEYSDASEVYEILTYLAYSYSIGKTRKRQIKIEDIRNMLEDAGKDPGQWLSRLEVDHILIRTGPTEYIIIHFNVMDFLTARFFVNKFENPDYLSKYEETIDFFNLDASFFKSDALPIAVGSKIQTGGLLLGALNRYLLQKREENQIPLLYRTAFKSLVEFENLVVRRISSVEINYSKKKIKKEAMKHIDAIKWIYIKLKKIILVTSRAEFEQNIEMYNGIPKLSWTLFLDKYLPYVEVFTGNPEIVTLRKEFLFKMLNRDLVETWLRAHKSEADAASMEREKHQLNTSSLDLLTLDSISHNSEDKNFHYYSDSVGKELKGFLGSPNLKHSTSISCLLVRDKIIFSGAGDGSIKLWDLETGKERYTFEKQIHGITHLAVSGDVLVTGFYDGSIKLWNWRKREEMPPITGMNEKVSTLAAIGEKLILGTESGRILLWSIKKNAEIFSFNGHHEKVTCIKMNNNQITAGHKDGTIKIWDMDKKKAVKTIKGFIKNVCISCLDRTNNSIIAGASNGTIKVWDIESGQNIQTIKAHDKCVNSIACSGNRIVSGGGPYIKLWDAISSKELYSFKAHPLWVTCLALVGDTIVSGGGDAAIKLWGLETGIEIRSFKRHWEKVNSIDIQDKTIVSGADDGYIKIWDLEQGKDILTLEGHMYSIHSVRVSDNIIVSAGGDHSIKLWDLNTGKIIRTLKGHNSVVKHVAQIGYHIISADNDGEVKVWERKTGNEIHSFIGHNGRINCLSVSGQFVVIGAVDKTLRVWRISLNGGEFQSENVFLHREHHVGISCVAMEGTAIVSGSLDNKIRLWNLGSTDVFREFSGHKEKVNCLAIKQGRIISSANDNTIKIWEIENGNCLRSIVLPWTPLDIKFLPGSSTQFATANANGTITTFDLK